MSCVRWRVWVVSVGFLAGWAGCSKEQETSKYKPREEPTFKPMAAQGGEQHSTSAQTKPAAEAVAGHQGSEASPALPPGHPPIGNVTTPEEPKEEAPRLTFSPPAEWRATQPRNAMIRQAFQLPAAEGDAEGGALEITHFPGMSVPLQMNIDRWAASFTQPDGQPTRKVVTQKQVEGAAHPTTLVDISGTYRAQSMGASVGEAKEKYRMLAVEIRSPNGPWFVKFVGPEKTVARWEEAFTAFARDAK